MADLWLTKDNDGRYLWTREPLKHSGGSYFFTDDDRYFGSVEEVPANVCSMMLKREIKDGECVPIYVTEEKPQ